MTRNRILFIVAAVSIGIATAHLEGLNGTAWGKVTVAGTGVPQPIIQDNFDDNKRGNMWKAFADDPNCKVQESGKHLEFIAKATPNNIFAGYVADKWSIDPNHDFAMRVDMSYDLVTMNGGWFSFGVTPSPSEPRKQYVSLGIGCVSVYPSYWREYKDGYEVRWDFDGRLRTGTTLYISYDSANDTVWLSDSGYGSENAWQTLTGVIKARWPRKPLYVFLGGNAENVLVESGHAFADNFALDSGVTGNPDKPTDPNKPPDPNTELTEVVADALILPAVITRQGPARAVTAFLSLPAGLLPADVDGSQPLVLLPGGAEATKHTTFMWLSGQVVVRASFNRTKLLETVTTDGDVSLQVVGRLKDGRRFSGIYTIKIQ